MWGGERRAPRPDACIRDAIAALPNAAARQPCFPGSTPRRALTTSRKPVLLDRSRLAGGLATAHQFGHVQIESRGVPSMDEQALRGLIAKVKDGKLSRRAFVHRMVALGLTAPMASQMLDFCGVAQAQADVRVQADQARRRRRAQGAVVAGRDAAQSALRRRHQGPGRLAHLLRAARRLGRGRQPGAGPRRRDPEPRERRPGRRRHVGHLEAQAGRASGTTASRSPPTTSSSTGNTPPIRRPPPSPSAATRTSRSRRSTTSRVTRHASPSRRRSGPTPSSARAA